MAGLIVPLWFLLLRCCWHRCSFNGPCIVAAEKNTSRKTKRRFFMAPYKAHPQEGAHTQRARFQRSTSITVRNSSKEVYNFTRDRRRDEAAMEVNTSPPTGPLSRLVHCNKTSCSLLLFVIVSPTYPPPLFTCSSEDPFQRGKSHSPGPFPIAFLGTQVRSPRSARAGWPHHGAPQGGRVQDQRRPRARVRPRRVHPSQAHVSRGRYSRRSGDFIVQSTARAR